MLFEAKDAAIVKTYALKNSIAVKQTMIEHRYFCVCFRIKFSVDENLRFLDTRCRTRPTFYCRFNCLVAQSKREIGGTHGIIEVLHLRYAAADRRVLPDVYRALRLEAFCCGL